MHEPSGGAQQPGPGPWVVPDALEVACGTMVGFQSDVAPLHPDEHDGRDLTQVLSAELLRHLQHGPCFVSFSGGRDSSAVLALAAAVARTHGLAPPVPLTQRYPGADDADEQEWQQLVVDHLDLDDWLIITPHQDMDVVSDQARRFVERHGLVHPANAFLWQPAIDAVGEGTLLTGIGGDELFDTPANAALAMLRFRQRPGRRHVRALPSLIPGVGQRQFAAAVAAAAPWLTPHAVQLIEDRLLARHVPARWDGGLRVWVTNRYYLGALTGLDAMSADRCRVVAPLLARPVLAAAAAAQGAAGYPSRTAAMRRHFGHVLPEAVVSRRSKAVFNQVLRSGGTQSFARTWDGTGVDPSLVDVDVLRQHLLAQSGPMPSALVAQQAAFGVLPPQPSADLSRTRPGRWPRPRRRH